MSKKLKSAYDVAMERLSKTEAIEQPMIPPQANTKILDVVYSKPPIDKVEFVTDLPSKVCGSRKKTPKQGKI